MRAARSRMPRIPVPGSPPARRPRPRSETVTIRPPLRAAQAQLGVIGAGVARDVGQRLLRHAVDDELLLVAELGQMLVEVLADARSRSAGAKRSHSTASALTSPRSSSASGRSSSAIRRTSSRLARTASWMSSTSRAQRLVEHAAHAGEAEQHRGQLLADLVVQLQRDAQPLGLLGLEHPAGGLAPLGLQAGQHLVEGERQLARLRGGAGAGHAGAGPREVDAPRQRGQRLQRADDPPQHDEVDERHQHERRRRARPPRRRRTRRTCAARGPRASPRPRPPAPAR